MQKPVHVLGDVSGLWNATLTHGRSLSREGRGFDPQQTYKMVSVISHGPAHGS